jgi:hypothetical protein
LIRLIFEKESLRRTFVSYNPEKTKIERINPTTNETALVNFVEGSLSHESCCMFNILEPLELGAFKLGIGLSMHILVCGLKTTIEATEYTEAV